MRWTQWPTSAVGSGSCADFRPLLIGFHVLPASSVRNAPAAEMAMKIRPGIARIEEDRVEAHPAGARLPARARAVLAQAGELLPRLPAVGRTEQGGVLDAGVDGVGIGQRRLEVPDALELPGAGRAVVPLVGAGDAVVDELVPHRLPRLAAVVGALDLLPEPAARLRRVEPIRVGGRSLEVVHLPAREVGTADVPPLALSIRSQDERALLRADENPYSAHASAPFGARGYGVRVAIGKDFCAPAIRPGSPRASGRARGTGSAASGPRRARSGGSRP